MAMSIKKFFKVAQTMPVVEEEPKRVVTPKELKEVVHDPTEDMTPEEAYEYLAEPEETVAEETVEETPVAEETEEVKEVSEDTTEDSVESDGLGVDPDESSIYTSDETKSDDVVAEAAEDSKDEVTEDSPDMPSKPSLKLKWGKLSPTFKAAAAMAGVLVLAGGITAASMSLQPQASQDSETTQAETAEAMTSSVDSAVSAVQSAIASVSSEVVSAPEDAAASESTETTVDTSDNSTTEPTTPAVTWSTRYVLIKHPAQTHTVNHAATYEMVTEYHTVCNICQEEIDGKTAEHEAATGHNSYSTNVPVEREHVKTEAWSETVVDKEAYSELVEDGEKSSDGQVRNNKYNDDGTLK